VTVGKALGKETTAERGEGEIVGKGGRGRDE
jgi:hypothetical protein